MAPDDTWLDAELRRLLDFGRRIIHPIGGAAWLDDTGAPDLTRPVHTWITSRTVHVYALGAMLGVEGCASIATAALDGLRTTLHDDEHGGWFGAVDGTGAPVATGKSCYDHAFVMLAASSAVAAGLPGADGLLHEATRIFEDHFWDEPIGRVVDEWDRDWTTKPHAQVRRRSLGVGSGGRSIPLPRSKTPVPGGGRSRGQISVSSSGSTSPRRASSRSLAPRSFWHLPNGVRSTPTTWSSATRC